MSKFKFISYPKSGRTWIKTILAYNAYDDITGDKVYYAGKMHKISFTHAGANDMEPLPEITNDVIHSERNTILLTRNPLDTIASYYHELNYRHDKEVYGQISLDKVIQVRFEMLLEYNHRWAEIVKKSGGLHLKYEEINIESIMKLFKFIGHPISKKRAKSLIDKASFEKIKKMEKAGKLNDHSSFNPTDPKNNDTYKARCGKVGGYKETLAQYQIDICNHIMRVFNDVR